MDIGSRIIPAATVITAVYSAAKMIADKESKISDFRKEWTSSFRDALANCLAEAHAIAGRIRIRSEHDGEISTADKAKLEDALLEHWVSFRRTYRLVLLHLNFAETSQILIFSEVKTTQDTGAPTEEADHECTGLNALRTLELGATPPAANVPPLPEIKKLTDPQDRPTGIRYWLARG